MLAAILIGVGCGIWVPPHRSVRVRRSHRELRPIATPAPPILGATCVAVVVLLYFDGWFAVAAAPAAGAGAYLAISRLESRSARERRAKLQAALPVGIDLMGAALNAGRPVHQAMALAARAVGGPLGEDLGRSADLADFGDTSKAWRELAEHRDLGRLGRALLRAENSGASVTQVFARTADEVRRDAAAEGARRARSVAVQTAGPLGACFLPAFVLIAVVPTIVSAFLQFSL